MTPTLRAADDARMRAGRTASIALTAVGVAAVWALAVEDPSGHRWWQLAAIVAVVREGEFGEVHGMVPSLVGSGRTSFLDCRPIERGSRQHDHWSARAWLH